MAWIHRWARARRARTLAAELEERTPMHSNSTRSRRLAVLLALACGATRVAADTFLDVNDCSPSIVISLDRLGVTYTVSNVQAVRSNRALEPGSGFFYFEGTRLAGVEDYGFGLATANASLSAWGGTDSEGESLGANVGGGIWYGGDFVGSFPYAFNPTYGIAVDYRGIHPIAYVIAREVAGGPSHVFKRVVLNQITSAVHILVYGTPTTTGVQQELNPGNDLARADFVLDPVAALDAAYYRGSEGLVLGWNPPPDLRVSVDQRVFVIGSDITAHGHATVQPKLRAADGSDLTSAITWSESRGTATGNGETFSFTPDLLGTYELAARVAGAEGASVTARVSVTVISSPALDSDGDGLSYAQESALGTDPATADSDHDGLRDDDELEFTNTDPLSRDSDGDGMNDAWEVRNALDPRVSNADADPDGDGFTNLQEYQAQTDPRSNGSYPGRGTVLLSATDKAPSVQLSTDGLGASFTAAGSHGVRSDVSVAPGSGWFYFEGHRECATGAFGFGLASASASLDAPGGADDQSLGVLASGALVYAGREIGTFDDPASVEWYGFALDYSGALPRVHVIVDRVGDTPRVSPALTLTGITGPVHLLVFGERVTSGVQQTINAGADPFRHAFHYPAAYLVYLAGAPGAEFMGSGFGPEHAYDGPPRIARQDPVELVREPATNALIVLAPDHLGASYNAYQKSAVRANQPMIGEFRYFETQRHVEPNNFGQGVINPFAALDPYCCVSFDTHNAPPSMSMNSVGSIWQNLVWQANFPRENDTYGFAVDYRGARPTVYCIVGGQLMATLTLNDFITPIVPMLYGDPAGPVLVNTINFGARPFLYEPESVLADAGIDPTELVRGWGDANRPSAHPNVRARLEITAVPGEVALGDPLSATALASDVDRSNVSRFIEWSDSASPARGRGAHFVFTPTTLGVHELRATLTDSLGSSSAAVADVRVTRYRPHSAP